MKAFLIAAALCMLYVALAQTNTDKPAPAPAPAYKVQDSAQLRAGYARYLAEHRARVLAQQQQDALNDIAAELRAVRLQRQLDAIDAIK